MHPGRDRNDGERRVTPLPEQEGTRSAHTGNFPEPEAGLGPERAPGQTKTGITVLEYVAHHEWIMVPLAKATRHAGSTANRGSFVLPN